jgi:hypothetical protein
MPIRSRNRFALVVIAVAISSVLLAISFWVAPHSLLGWLVLLIAGIPAWLFLEWLGGGALGMPFFQRLPSTARILVGIPVVIVLMTAAFLVSLLVQKMVLAL